MAKISRISIPPSSDMEGLRKSVEAAMNRTIDQLNIPKAPTDIDMNFNRVIRMKGAILDDDAVSLKQLKEFVSGRRRQLEEAGETVRILNFELNGAVATGDDQTVHLELPIDATATASPLEAYVNVKTAGTSSMTVDVEYSYDPCTEDPRAWATIFGTGTDRMILPASKDQLCAPHTTFENLSFQRSTLFRCNVDTAGGQEDALIMVVLTVD